MTQLSHQPYPAYDPIQLIGTIEQINDQYYRVSCDGKTWQCRRAASCLLQPALGDTVLISGPDSQRVFLLAVIDQLNPSQAVIRVGGDLQIESQTLNLKAARGTWQIEQLQYCGEKVSATIGVLRLVGRAYEMVVDRIRAMSRNSLRITSEIDKTRVGTLDMQAEEAARIHAPFTTVTAGEVVKVDGRQIHMG